MRLCFFGRTLHQVVAHCVRVSRGKKKAPVGSSVLKCAASSHAFGLLRVWISCCWAKRGTQLHHERLSPLHLQVPPTKTFPPPCLMRAVGRSLHTNQPFALAQAV
jgi:hypothetical protein